MVVIVFQLAPYLSLLFRSLHLYVPRAPTYTHCNGRNKKFFNVRGMVIQLKTNRLQKIFLASRSRMRVICRSRNKVKYDFRAKYKWTYEWININMIKEINFDRQNIVVGIWKSIVFFIYIYILYKINWDLLICVGILISCYLLTIICMRIYSTK